MGWEETGWESSLLNRLKPFGLLFAAVGEKLRDPAMESEQVPTPG
jgi:hypothetical protein